MDAQSEQNWANLIEKLSQGRTVVMVEHRQVALQGVDELIKIENGKVIDHQILKTNSLKTNSLKIEEVLS